jgi:hypothetical protein
VRKLIKNRILKNDNKTEWLKEKGSPETEEKQPQSKRKNYFSAEIK